MTAASIRFNNPGAMWGRNAISRRWGETSTVTLNDGLGQGNNIAFFPTKVDGACAQFDLWRTNYCNMTLDAAIRKWSGGNSSPQYMNFLQQKTGLGPSAMVTGVLLQGRSGLELMKAQAQWEAGMVYPLADSDWATAQAKVFSGKPPVKTATKKATAAASTATVGTTTVAAAAQGGAPWWLLLGLAIAFALIGVGLWFYFHHKEAAQKPALQAPPATVPPGPTPPPENVLAPKG